MRMCTEQYVLSGRSQQYLEAMSRLARYGGDASFQALSQGCSIMRMKENTSAIVTSPPI